MKRHCEARCKPLRCRSRFLIAVAAAVSLSGITRAQPARTYTPPPLTAEDVDGLLTPIMPELNRQEFSARHDTDFAYEILDFARFRANAFVDRKGPGAVFRVIPSKILTAEQLGLSQSAVSRQVSALEQELGVSLFHRHARGLILTEQGELLHHTAQDVLMKLEAARAKLTDSKERPNGELRVQTTPGIGVHWLTPRLGEFIDLYPDIRLTLITTDEELDLAMREADVAIRLRLPTQPDLIQRKLFSVRFHAYASPEYLKRFGTPRALDDLDDHRVLLLGGTVVPNSLSAKRRKP